MQAYYPDCYGVLKKVRVHNLKRVITETWVTAEDGSFQQMVQPEDIKYVEEVYDNGSKACNGSGRSVDLRPEQKRSL